MIEDSALFVRLQSEEPESAEALKELFFRYGRPMLRFARRFTDDRDAAEDIVQNVFLSIWRNRKALRIEKELKVYLFAAVRNQSLKVLRDAETEHRAHESLRLTIAPSEAAPDPVGFDQLRHHVELAVQELPEKCRRVFLMNRLDGLTYSQIAAVLGISPKTVETQMGRALKRLRESLR